MDAPDRMEVGVIEQLSDKQAEVMSIINDARDEDDKSMEQGFLGSLGYKDDIITAMVIAKIELSGTEIVPMDLMWASAFLDHLDTLGYRVKRKK